MRILGIDFGTKRVGVAMSDPDQHFALPLTTIDNNKDLVSDICKLAEENDVKKIVIGESRDYKGEPNKILSSIHELKKNLESHDLEVFLEPEFMTTIQAERWQGRNEKIDSSAAAIILQSYLDRIKSK